MNVYDFDKTIYDGDSTRDFIIYAFLRDFSLFKYMPSQFIAFLAWKLGKKSKTEFKEKLFRMFSGIDEIDRFVADFWKKYDNKIKRFYHKQRRDDDLIISASPEFLLKPICQKLGIDLIASRVDKFTGHYTGLNCYGEEKVKRFYEEGYQKESVEGFYSDSYSDTPLARLAKEAYVVEGEALSLWDWAIAERKCSHE